MKTQQIETRDFFVAILHIKHDACAKECYVDWDCIDRIRELALRQVPIHQFVRSRHPLKDASSGESIGNSI